MDIESARKIAELEEENATLRKSIQSVELEKSRLQAVIDNIPAPVYMKDISGRYLLVNCFYEDLSGVSRDQIHQKTDFDFYDEETATLFRNQDSEVRRQRKPVDFEETVSLESGVFTFITLKFPVRDALGEIYAVGGFCTDITQRKIVEEDLRRTKDSLERKVKKRTRKLRESQAFFHSIFEESPYPVLITDDKGIALLQNRACREYWNVADDELLGSYNIFADQMFKKEDVLSVVRGIFEDGKTAKFILELDAKSFSARTGGTRKEGAILEYMMYPIANKDGTVSNVIIQQFDITHKQKAAEEKECLEKQVHQLQKMEAIGTLATGVAHEINQPLSFLRIIFEATQQSLKGDNLDCAELKDDCRESLRQIARISGIINHLREFSRTGSGMNSLILIDDVVANSLVLMRERLRLQNIVLTTEIPSEAPKLTGDPVKLEQVFINLLQNSIDALEETPEPQIKVFVRTDKQHCIINYCDNGAKILANDAEKIFDPFFTTKAVGKGTGLGLSICYEIIQNHGGTMTYLSEKEETTFQITLPVG